VWLPFPPVSGKDGIFLSLRSGTFSWFRLRAAALAVGLLAGCAGGESAGGAREAGPHGAGGVSAVDDAGRTVSLPRPATRIVSLLPAATETLVALGAGGTLVARTDYDDDPELAGLPSVGGGLTPSLEILASLRPDLVIAWEEAGAARIRPRLEALGIAVFALQTQDTAGILANVARFGHLLGREAAADSLGAEIRGQLAAVSASVPPGERPTVLYLIGIEPPLVAGPRLFIGEVLEAAGGRNAFFDVTAPSPQVSLEEIVRRSPAVVLVPSRDSAAVIARLRGAPGWRELLERGDTRVTVLPPDILHRPGPSIVPAAWLILRAIHPGAIEGM
jgi:iron complex transport system substrate-binding protein